MSESQVWRILLIDDDEDDYVLVSHMLSVTQGRKCKLDWEASFNAGRKAVEINRYDVVLVDYDLGPQTGLQLIREFISKNYPSPFILFTGRGSYHIDVEAMDAGATIYLTKSEVNPLLLERSIRYAIEHKQIQNALAAANAGLLIQQRELMLQNELLREEIAERKRMESALLKNEAALRGILDAVKESVWLFDPQGVIRLANETALERLKRNAGEVIGQNFRQFMSPELAQARYLRLREVAETGQPVVFEDERTGMLFIHSFYPVKDSDGTVTGIASFSRDITKINKAEDIRREQDEMFRLAMAAGHVGAWSWNYQTGTLSWSDEYYSILGLEPRSIKPSLKAGLSRVHPEDLPRVKESVRLLLEKPSSQDEVYRVIWPDGSLHWVRAISRPFFNEHGEPYRISGLIMDKTEQKKAEHELLAAHKRTIEILESIGDAFYSLDKEFCFSYVNRRAGTIWRMDPAALIGKPIWDVFPMFTSTESYPRFMKAMREASPDHFETYSRFLDQWIEIHLYPTENGLSVYFQDITERRRMEENLKNL